MPKRTTVTLDDDVAAKLEDETRKTRTPLRQVLNSALRRGLEPGTPRGRKRFKIRSRDLGTRAGVNFDCISRLLAELDESAKK